MHTSVTYQDFFDKNDEIVKIIPENPYVVSATNVPGEHYPELDYKNYKKIFVKNIAFLPNEEFFKAHKLQNFGTAIMLFTILNMFFSMLYIGIGFWPITLTTFISIFGFYGVRIFNDSIILFYLIFTGISSLIKMIVFFYLCTDKIFIQIYISLCLFILEIIIFFSLYYFKKMIVPENI